MCITNFNNTTMSVNNANETAQGGSVSISAKESQNDLDKYLDNLSISGNLAGAELVAQAQLSPASKKGLRPILKRKSSIDDFSYISDKSQSSLCIANSRSKNGSSKITPNTMDVSISSIESEGISLGMSLSSSRRALRRVSSQVSFTSVEVREYDRTLGDNPSCMSGPPISLDWNYSKESQHCMEQYEKVKEMKSGNRGKNLYRMGKAKRIEILQNQLGYTEDEIKEATKKKREIQRARSLTNMTSSMWRVEDVAQSATRKLKRVIRPKRNKSDMSSNPLSASTTSNGSNSSTNSVDSTLVI